MVKQKTIKTEISLTGVGLHTGKEVIMTFKPAPSNNGFTFVRVDLEGHPVEADANYVVNTTRHQFRKTWCENTNPGTCFSGSGL
jgi:UDP-3-O-[3-hydroxymyristoyl] N-acetylglucosamine deacetylase/3-hydroxyacyl-[acyl-carrier-protein] dehydratase